MGRARPVLAAVFAGFIFAAGAFLVIRQRDTDVEPEADESQSECSCADKGERVVLMGGTDIFSADLYLYCPESRDFARLTTGARISSMGSSSTAIVVASAIRKIDRIYAFTGEDLRPLRGLGPIHAFSPDVSENGTVVYDKLVPPGFRLLHLTVWDPRTKKTSVVASGRQPFSSTWGPRETLAYLEGGKHPSLHLVSSSGAQQTLQTDVLDARRVIWDGSTYITIGELAKGTRRIHLIDPDTGRQRTIHGWERPVAWRPDGRTLLVAKGSTLGEVRLPSLEVNEVARFPHGDVYEGAWLKGCPTGSAPS